jgi:SAM-dependent methyltransferase
LSYSDKFKYRSSETELLDQPEVTKELLFRNLKELDFINRISGGNSMSIYGIKKLVHSKNKLYHIVDLGCGGGGTMKHIADWAKKNGYSLSLTGVDKNADAIQYMRESCKNYSEIRGVVSDYNDYLNMASDMDIVHCSLFCHHLNEEELIGLFGSLKNRVRSGFVINDLQRNWLAYYGVQLITHLLNGSSLSKNDGPISVLRGFSYEELNTMLRKAMIQEFSIQWKWAFRYLIVAYS